MSHMEKQVEATTVMNPIIFPVRRMRCDNYLIQKDNLAPEINDGFRGRSPRLFWMVVVTDKAYQGDFGANPFNFHANNATTVYCMANGVPVPKMSVDLNKPYEVFDLLLNASGKNKRDAYLLDPDSFHEGYFICPFDLTAVQDGGETSTPLIPMLVNVRLQFTSLGAPLQILFFYNTDESLLQIDNRGTVKGPIPLGDV